MELEESEPEQPSTETKEMVCVCVCVRERERERERERGGVQCRGSERRGEKEGKLFSITSGGGPTLSSPCSSPTFSSTNSHTYFSRPDGDSSWLQP